ncbi:hypothetical protein ACP4OV_000366 [Aristida adscensionis]
MAGDRAGSGVGHQGGLLRGGLEPDLEERRALAAEKVEPVGDQEHLLPGANGGVNTGKWAASLGVLPDEILVVPSSQSVRVQGHRAKLFRTALEVVREGSPLLTQYKTASATPEAGQVDGKGATQMKGGVDELEDDWGWLDLDQARDDDDWSWMDDPIEKAFLCNRAIDFEQEAMDFDALPEAVITGSDDHWYYSFEKEWKMEPPVLTESEKEAYIARFPTDEELKDKCHWYNRTRSMCWRMDAGKECALCGFQGHVARYCPSPRKWRLEMEGKLSKKTRGDRYQIPHRRGSDWMRDQEKLKRGEPPAWMKAM